MKRSPKSKRGFASVVSHSVVIRPKQTKGGKIGGNHGICGKRKQKGKGEGEGQGEGEGEEERRRRKKRKKRGSLVVEVATARRSGETALAIATAMKVASNPGMLISSFLHLSASFYFLFFSVCVMQDKNKEEGLLEMRGN
ncbi:hypothetical protein AAC387_Pa08g0527 [Persea americana]